MKYNSPTTEEVIAMLKTTGLSKGDISKELGINRSTLSRWVNGSSSIGEASWMKLKDLVHNKKNYVLKRCCSELSIAFNMEYDEVYKALSFIKDR